MLIPEAQSHVPGIHLDITHHTDNLARSPELGHPALFDGYAEIITVSDGTNPDYPEVGTWRTLLVRQQPNAELTFEDNGNATIFPFYPGDTIAEVLMVQDSLMLDDGDIESYGLWQIIRFDRPGEGQLSAVILFKTLNPVIQRQHAYGGN